ncbi:PAS domain S-box protein [Nostoc punctiforme]|uniref:histidine kinase n=1 Tax=Nostoc punctiforme (strain ATCC 29133 / PCC 73102) TaxID=63737 RepID=B2JAQ0_NOSP7|nr:PAS domain S-box protein [Nostoc punctiforme]ACC85004.1 PAS/PAC sensor signal transduction histidine kinase [Nostoc punctiforme PCC 73102]
MSQNYFFNSDLQRDDLYCSFLENLPIAAAILDCEMKYLLTSQGWLSELGLEGQDIIGRSHLEVFRQFCEPLTQAYQYCLMAAVELCVEEQFQQVDGLTGWRQWTLRPWCSSTRVVNGVMLVAEDVTDRKQAELALRHSEERYRFLITAISQIIWDTKAEGEFINEQPGWSAFTGQTFEELKGWGWLNAVHPDDRLHTAKVWSQAVASRTLYKLEHRLRRHDGEYCHMSVRAFPILNPDGGIREWIGVHTDITEYKQAQEAMLCLAAIVESSDDAIISKTLDGVIVSWNRGAEALFGYQAQEVIGQPMAMLVPGDRINEEPQILKKLRQGERVDHFETVRQRKDGTLIDLSLTISPVKDSTGKIIGASKIARDISARKDAQEALRQKAADLETTLLELKRTQTQLVQNEKMSSLGQLVAGVAHEINNPVNFIYANFKPANEYIQHLLGLLQLYQQHYPSPAPEIQGKSEEIDLEFLLEDLPKLLCSMEVGADRIKKIVLSLRNFSRMDEAEMKAVNIHEGIDSTLMILQNRLKAKHDHPGIEIIKEYGNLPLVECYAGQLNQVFMNIISNAIDALEEPHQSCTLQEIEQKTSEIRIFTAMVGSDHVQIRIVDNGPGIPEFVQKRLCDPFFTTKPVGKGTGLGMSISYQIVTEKHGGSLRYHSIPGQGAEFVIEIPIRQSKCTLPMLGDKTANKTISETTLMVLSDFGDQ